MSKSKGNVIDPLDVLEKYGAEPMRLWVAIEGNLEKQDFRCSLERIETGGNTPKASHVRKITTPGWVPLETGVTILLI